MRVLTNLLFQPYTRFQGGYAYYFPPESLPPTVTSSHQGPPPHLADSCLLRHLLGRPV